MITIDTNMYLLCNLFNINSAKLESDYSGLSVDEIMKKEAAQGNAAAAHYEQILSDPQKLIELFQLNDPNNKFAILSNMNEYDLDDLLPFLSQEDLMEGLKFFTKDKLLKMVEEIPMEQLVNYTLQMFTPEQLMYMMPEEELNKVLMSPNMDKELQMKTLQTLKPEILIQMYESVTGKPISYVLNQDINSAPTGTEDAGEMQMSSNGTFVPLKPVVAEIGLGGNIKNIDVANLLNQLTSLPDDKFKEALLSIPRANKQGYVLAMSKENPEIFMMFDPKAYTNILGQKKDKNDLIKYSNVIEHPQLVKMAQELPQDLTAVLVTQISTKKLADVLLSNFKNILRDIVAG